MANVESTFVIRGFAHTCKGRSKAPRAYVELCSVSANGSERPVQFKGSYVQAVYVRWLLDNAEEVRAALDDADLSVMAQTEETAPAAAAPVAVSAPAAAMDPAALAGVIQQTIAAQFAAMGIVMPGAVPATAPSAAAAPVVAVPKTAPAQKSAPLSGAVGKVRAASQR